jgi:hypothetical protein
MAGKLLCGMVKTYTSSFIYFREDLKFYFFVKFSVFDISEKWHELEDLPE